MKESAAGGDLKLKIALGVLGLLVLAGGIWLIGKRNTSGDDAPPPLTKDQLARYQVGDFYRTVVNTHISGTVEDADWAVNKIGSILYQGEVDVLREVKSNKKETGVEIALQVRRARDLTFQINLEDLKLEVPPIAGNLLLFATNAPPAAKIGFAALKKDWVRGALIDTVDAAVRAASGKSLEELLLPPLPSIDHLEGCGGTFVYIADKGLTQFETKGTLSREDERRLKDFSVFAESHLLPAPGEGGPEEWDVDVDNIAHLLVPASKIEVEGSLRFARRERAGDILRLEVVRGVVDFVGAGETTETLGSWAARGSLYYNLSQNVVVEGKLSGEISLEKRSTDHILFEKRWAAKPDYEVIISGFQTRSKSEAERDLTPAELQRAGR